MREIARAISGVFTVNSVEECEEFEKFEEFGSPDWKMKRRLKIVISIELIIIMYLEE